MPVPHDYLLGGAGLLAFRSATDDEVSGVFVVDYVQRYLLLCHRRFQIRLETIRHFGNEYLRPSGNLSCWLGFRWLRLGKSGELKQQHGRDAAYESVSLSFHRGSFASSNLHF